MKLSAVVLVSLLLLLFAPLFSHAEMSSSKYSITKDSISGIEITDNLQDPAIGVDVLKQDKKPKSKLSNMANILSALGPYTIEIIVLVIALVLVSRFLFFRIRKNKRTKQ